MLTQNRTRSLTIVLVTDSLVVGHLPVLRPGQVFEYTSGTELATAKGIMRGHLYMARVPEGAISAKSGDDIEALKLSDKLKVAVSPFPLDAH
jgi:uncharacterized protein affecting Mg2+/Co2+ transport